MRKTFFTSDLHFFHANILKYTNRPFRSVLEMNEALINNWNSCVSKSDIIWIIGDFAFADETKILNIVSRLNGEKHFVMGNHDQIFKKHDFKQELKKHNFIVHSALEEIYVVDANHSHGKQHIALCHFAMRVWNKSHRGSWHLYGHSHGTLPDDLNSLSTDVGVDRWNYTPVEYAELKELFSTRKFAAVDHHGA